MITLMMALLFMDTPVLAEHRFRDLPDWAQDELADIDLKKAPEDAQVWCLLNDTLLGFNKEGELMVRHRVIHVVLDQGGAEAASVYAQGVSEDVGRVMRITGFHVPLQGPFQKVDRDDTVTYGTSQVGELNRGAVSTTGFEFVSKGSVVVFESVKRERHYLGAVGFYPMLHQFPTKKYHIKLVEEGGKGEFARLIARGVEEWGLKKEDNTNELTVYDLPELRQVALMAPHPNFYPHVTAQFLATEAERDRYKSWDHYAKWYWEVFESTALDKPAPPLGTVTTEILKRMGKPLRERIAYQQVYLTNARGFEPSPGSEVMRRAYGDCKDMTACFAHMGEADNVLVYPVLANIAEGAYTDGRSHVYPSFNHLIAAVPLQKSLGLPAEVVSGSQRFLLFDATSADTSFGYLPRHYIGRSVLVCTPKGAVWIDVPDKALEPGKLTLSLKGDLDAQLNFVGSLELHEQGNAYSYRTALKRYGKSFAHAMMENRLPANVVLKLESFSADDNGDVRMRWSVSWPEFLSSFSTSHRLPQAILPRFDMSLRYAGSARIMPILIDDLPPMEWDLQLRCAKVVVPVKRTAGFDDGKWYFKWKAEGGSVLRAQFQMGMQQTIYSRARTGNGIQAWQRFQKEFNQFARQETILSVE